MPSQFDLDVLSLVERGVARLRIDNAKAYQCLVEYYGAYPDAPKERGERLKRLNRIGGIKKSAVYKHLETGKAYLQGIIDIYTSDMP